MKKTLLVAALAIGFTGVAQAETSVTLYGLIDAGLGYEQVKGANGFKQSHIGATNGVSNGSRWGLRGSEDLGSGLKAIFTLESGFNNETGTSSQGGRLFGRQATVGLANDAWGTLEFGRQKNVASKYLESISPFGTDYALASSGAAFSSAQSTRYDNMVMYQTPSFAGFRAAVGYSFAVDGAGNFATNNNTRAITSGLRYTNGPLDLFGTYDQFKGSTANDDVPKVRSYILGAAYDFEVVKLSAAWGQTRNGWFTAVNPGTTGDSNVGLPSLRTADGFRADSLMVGATVPFGATKLLASYQRVDPKNDKLIAGAEETTNIFSLGATYDLSKRTNLYAYASYADNYAFQDDLRSTAFAVGLRHRF
ncbi:porin [Bordetella genomosp. 13]|uniref:porin n=1 Tax=Bordetella genomosp. 13 TaxID=463040 RepID=UPI0011A737AD|nr:porin [Bordetella genomosp. 13]